MTISEDRPVIFYDGECKFCHRSIDFVLANETSPLLKFSWLQSEQASSVISDGVPDSLILLEDGVLYHESTAALRLCGYLKPRYRWAKGLLIIPRPIRDVVYRFISANRKKIMGSTSCALPIGKEDRFP